jgi:integrase
MYTIASGGTLPSTSIRDHLKAWLERKAIEAKPATHRRYSTVVGHFLRHLGDIADRDISHLDAKTIAGVRDKISKEKSPSTANHAVKVIRAALNQARRDGLVDQNEASKITLIKCHPNRRESFSLDQIARLLSVANEEWTGIILAGLYTGQRLGDIATLTWNNIDLQKREIHHFAEKQGKSINIPIAEPLMEYLESTPAGDVPDAPLFPKAYDRVLSQEGRTGTLSGQFRRIMEAAGLVPKRTWKSTGKGRTATRVFNPLTFHSLRHTATSLFKEAGVPHAVVQDIIGHESEAVSRIYTHVGDPAKRDAINKLPNLPVL